MNAKTRTNGAPREQPRRQPALPGSIGGIDPHNAEVALLGGVLLYGHDAHAALESVLPLVCADDFNVPACAAVFSTMVQLREMGEPIDVLTLEKRLRLRGELEMVGGLEGLTRLDKHATARSLDAYARIVFAASQRRRMRRWLMDRAEDLVKREELGDDDEWSRFVSRAGQEWADITVAGARGVQLIAARDVMVDYRRGLDAYARGDKPLATIGIPAVDEMVCPVPGTIGLVIARPGMGKTALMLAIATGCCFTSMPVQHRDDLRFAVNEHGPHVLIASAEMPNVALMGRFVSNLGGIENRVTKRPSRRDQDIHASRFASAERLINASRITFMPDTEANNFVRLVAAIRRWVSGMRDRESRPPPLVLIDYCQLLQIPGTFGREDLKYAEMAKQLNSLAKELGIIVVVLGQVVKAVTGREVARVKLGDIKEAAAFEDAANWVLSPYRPAAAGSNMSELGHRLAELRHKDHHGGGVTGEEADEIDALVEQLEEAYIDVIKAREGELGSVPARFVGRFVRFVVG